MTTHAPQTEGQDSAWSAFDRARAETHSRFIAPEADRAAILSEAVPHLLGLMPYDGQPRRWRHGEERQDRVRQAIEATRDDARRILLQATVEPGAPASVLRR